jgi:hypothetical protein
MARKFEFALRGDPYEKLARIKTAAARNIVFFQGDLKSGTFSGGVSLFGFDMTIKGSYRVEGEKIVITVSKKPSTMSWDQVESKLKGFVES